MKNYLYEEERPWGKFIVIDEEIDYKIKKLVVNPGKRLSYQYHKQRSESWTIIQGKALVTINDVEDIHEAGQLIKINETVKHRIENIGNDNLVLIEVQTGRYFGEDDIVRLEDDFNRP